MYFVNRHNVNVFSIITLIMTILSIIFFIVIIVYFNDIYNLRYPSPSTASIMFWLILFMIFALVGLVIYAIIYMATNKVYLKVLIPNNKGEIEGYDIDTCRIVVKKEIARSEKSGTYGTSEMSINVGTDINGDF